MQSPAETTRTITMTITRSVSARIAATGAPRDVIVLFASDLAVYNTDIPGATGAVQGTITTISQTGIALAYGGQPEWTYTATPRVVDGRVELTKIEVPNFPMHDIFLSSDGFEHGLADGINRALARHGLTPISLTLHHGSMRTETKPASH